MKKKKPNVLEEFVAFKIGIRTIKAIETNRFAIELMEMASGNYRIVWAKNETEPFTTEAIPDIMNALYIYDQKLIILEGN